MGFGYGIIELKIEESQARLMCLGKMKNANQLEIDIGHSKMSNGPIKL